MCGSLPQRFSLAFNSRARSPFSRRSLSLSLSLVRAAVAGRCSSFPLTNGQRQRRRMEPVQWAHTRLGTTRTRRRRHHCEAPAHWQCPARLWPVGARAVVPCRARRVRVCALCCLPVALTRAFFRPAAGVSAPPLSTENCSQAISRAPSLRTVAKRRRPRPTAALPPPAQVLSCNLQRRRQQLTTQNTTAASAGSHTKQLLISTHERTNGRTKERTNTNTNLDNTVCVCVRACVRLEEDDAENCISPSSLFL